MALRQEVFDYVSSRGDRGATYHEVASALKMKPVTAASCIFRLVKEGSLYHSGSYRRTTRDRMAQVWCQSRKAVREAKMKRVTVDIRKDQYSVLNRMAERYYKDTKTRTDLGALLRVAIDRCFVHSEKKAR